MSSRQYDIVLFGATGYTGKFTAEYITTTFPTDLKWAIAGRSQQKLNNIVEELKLINPDRKQPTIEVAQLQKDDLDALAKKTKVIINTVGPYTLYGEPVVEACANNGTHYLDVTGESPWVVEMIKKYDKTAKSTGAIIIPQIGVESSPADMVTYALVNHLKKSSLLPKEVVLSIHDVKGGFSGGTLNTVFTVFDKFSVSQTMNAGKPSAMSPIPVPKRSYQPSMFERLFGVRSVPDLGTLTTSIQAMADVPIVYRSWGLLRQAGTKDEYGPNFSFTPKMTVRNYFTGALGHLLLTIAPMFLLIPLVRRMLSRVVTQPGDGPSREDDEHHYFEYRGIAYPDSESKDRAFARLRYNRGAYALTALFVAEGAATILHDEDINAKKLGGGLLTPATLGQAYIDRLKKAGVVFDVKTLTS